MKDLTYTLEITTAKCFSCKENFKLYTAQKLNINFCGLCITSSKIFQLMTLGNILKKITIVAEKENKKIKDRLVVDVSLLVEELQKD